MYIIEIYSRLTVYIKFYRVYRLNATPRYKPFRVLKPILTLPLPRFTVAIDFIIGLPKTPRDNDYFLSSTDKYSKKIGLILGSSEFIG